jgi:hypothetical protein
VRRRRRYACFTVNQAGPFKNEMFLVSSSNDGGQTVSGCVGIVEY